MPFLKDSEIWIDGFAYFNPQERNIINELLKTAGTIHVSLLMDPDDDEANESQTGLFHDAWEIHELLKKMAVQEKQAVNYKVLRVAKRFKADGIAAVEKGLFSVLPFVGKASEGVRLVEAANRRRELEAAAADIVRLCRKEGYSWKEIGVLFRNPDDYGTLPEMIFGNYGIPFFCDFKRPGIHHPLAELIRSSFDVLQRWQYEPFMIHRNLLRNHCPVFFRYFRYIKFVTKRSCKSNMSPRFKWCYTANRMIWTVGYMRTH